MYSFFFLLFRQALKQCFETKDVSMLETALNSLSKEERAHHWQRCIDSGLWVTDAKAAGEDGGFKGILEIKCLSGLGFLLSN